MSTAQNTLLPIGILFTFAMIRNEKEVHNKEFGGSLVLGCRPPSPIATFTINNEKMFTFDIFFKLQELLKKLQGSFNE